jgi:hypothetical protein
MPPPYQHISLYFEPLGLELPKITALDADGSSYRTVLFQPKGEVEFLSTDGQFRIGNQDEALASSKFQKFFDTIDDNVALAVTPEYSCPWNTIRQQISDGNLPKMGNLWVIGCESIMPKELKAFKADFKDSLTIICEDEIETDPEDKFYDPVCIFFKTTETTSGNERDILVIQFKVQAMGGTKIEADHMILGRRRYIISNNLGDSIFLAVIICSDALILSDPCSIDPRFLPQPFLLLHLQLNPSSKYEAFKRYRMNYFLTSAKNDDKEVICLNWADGTKIHGGKGAVELESGGTAIFIKTPELDVSASRIAANDELGMAYHHWKSGETAVFQFAPEEGIFLFETYKCAQYLAPAANRKRTGPKMLTFYSWQTTDFIDKKFGPADYEASLNHLIGLSFSAEEFFPLFSGGLPTLDMERLIALTVGNVFPQYDNHGQITSNWDTIVNLRSMRLESSEFSNRLTFLFEKDLETVEKKRKIFVNYSAANQLLKANKIIPKIKRFEGFSPEGKLYYSKTFQNLLSKDGNKRATFVFIGMENSDCQAQIMFGRLVKILSRGLGNQQEATQARKMLIVGFSMPGSKVGVVYDKRKPDATQSSDVSHNSFLRIEKDD